MVCPTTGQSSRSSSIDTIRILNSLTLVSDTRNSARSAMIAKTMSVLLRRTSSLPRSVVLVRCVRRMLSTREA